MGSFTASLRSIGDVRALPATVELSDGRLSIVAGSTEIGSWSLDDIRLEETPTGYRMAAEGDQILIELRDVESLATELAKRNKKRLFGKEKDPSPKVTQATTPLQDISVTPHLEAKQVSIPSGVDLPPRETSEPPRVKSQTASSGVARKGMGLVDRILAKAQKRFGPYLPDWLFSRAMLVIGLSTLVALILFPGVFSVMLLIAGALLVLFGAVVYSDTVLASKWLPGRATPIQALVLGLTVLLLGILLGILAN
jgi:hypothetical protein